MIEITGLHGFEIISPDVRENEQWEQTKKSEREEIIVLRKIDSELFRFTIRSAVNEQDALLYKQSGSKAIEVNLN